MTDISLEADIFVKDKTSRFLQEIDTVFNTRLTDVLNDCRFGADFEQFLWSMSDNTDEITRYAKSLITSRCPSAAGFEWDAGCYCIYDDWGREYYMLAIVLLDEDKNPREKTYVFHDFGKDLPQIKSIHE